jgi:type II secretory ATPase GspE/PulE/Tfp pilus assembly ATPase PilB-like protein
VGLPAGAFQPVALCREDYESLRGRCLSGLLALGERSQSAMAGELPARGFPERHIRPAGLRAALQFLHEYYPLEGSDRNHVRALLVDPSLSPGRLPHPLQAAVGFLCRNHGLVDTSLLAPASLPPGLAGMDLGGLFVVAVRNNELWAAVESHPAPQVEDHLLNSLGEGWRVHLLLSCMEGEPVPAGGPSTPGCARGLISVDLEDSVGRQQAQGRAQPGEILITDRDIQELEHYDPRRPDRDPGRIFLRELSAAIRAGASDLHLEPGVDRFRIRARVDGLLEEWLETGVDFGQSIVGAAKELLGLPAERFLPQDGACVVRHGADAIGTRVSSFPIRKRRQKLVLRFLPRRGGVPLLAGLMPPWASGMLSRAASRPHGLILVCGPTGSGKTTTVFSALNAINSPSRNITTLEDPVEYELEGLNQAELDPLRGVGWDVLLRGFLRQDPDVGLIGEIRDQATAETAIRQALTGHLVFATLHTLSCAATLERLLDMGVKADMLASALTLVVSQRLVRRLCVQCRRADVPTVEEARYFETQGVQAPRQLWRPTEGGCSCCRAGYRGRVAAVEMLPVTDDVIMLIEDKSRARDFRTWMEVSGLPTVYEAALRLVASGETSLDDALEWRGVWDGFEWRIAP